MAHLQLPCEVTPYDFMRSRSNFFIIKVDPPFEVVKIKHKAAYISTSVESLKSHSLNILGEFLPMGS